MKITFQTKGDLNELNKWFDKVANGNSPMVLEKIAREGERSLKANTPRSSGATAEGWVSEVKINGNISEIAWRNIAHPDSGVSIAKLIELGHGTGTGGYVPPKPYIKNAMSPVWKSVDDMTKGLIR